MGNQQNLSPRVAERVFEVVFPSYMGLWRNWERRCFASIRFEGSSPFSSTVLTLYLHKLYPISLKGEHLSYKEKAEERYLYWVLGMVW